MSLEEVTYEIGVNVGDDEERDKVVGISFEEVTCEIGVNEGDDEERNKVD